MKTQIITPAMAIWATFITTLLNRVSAAPVANPVAGPVPDIEARADASSPLRREAAVAEIATREAKAEAEAGPEAYIEALPVAGNPEDWIIRAREAE